MCGRYTLKTEPVELAEHFQLVVLPELVARYNIAPTQAAPIVRAAESGGKRHMTSVQWGLIPSWAKDRSMGARMINARSETAATKPAFRGPMKYRRCVVPADGFYEWQKQGTGKQPYYIHLRDGGPFGLAGIWEHWEDADGSAIESCCILTTTPNELVQPIHDRMPVILRPADYEVWLDPAMQDAAAVQPLLRPCPDEMLTLYPVSRHVNSPRNDDERCIEPEQGGLFG